jgi:tetratricopeptide (TPR) repeat protein
MKKIILLMTLVAVVQAGVAQQTVHRLPPENRFNEGKALFLEGDYAAAHEMLAEFLDRSDDAALREEAEYMMAACGFYRGEEHGGERLMAFLKEHPESVHRNEGAFLVASYFFDRKEWQTAKEWFDRCSIDYLTPSEQEEYGFRRAYTLLQMGMKDEAERWFGLLYQNSKKYADAADYYLGYIAYSRGEYASALERFNRLKNHPMYGEEASFYEAQAVFFDGKLEEAVRLAEAFVEAYPQSGHLGEMYRVLGNANYRLGYANRALTYYEKYMATTDKPLRGDAYFMGLAYIDAGKYADAIRMLQLAVGPADKLTQHAQLQLGQLYLRQGDKQQAQFAFEAASREDFDPKVTETALYNYALLVHETNMSVFGESIALFEKFLRMYPDSPYAEKVNDILAETFLSAKDYEAALEAINRIANPGRRILEAKQMVLFQLGAQQFINGDLNEAIRLFTSCIGMGNYDAEARNSAYFWRGESYYRMGNYRNAEADFKAFVDNARPTDKNYALGWYSLGYAQFNQNRYAEALRSFQQYLAAETNKNRPEYADALNRLGDIYYYNRNFAEAERRYAQAAEVNPQAADYAAFQKAFVMGLQRNYEGKIRELDELMRRYPNSIYFFDKMLCTRTLSEIAGVML